MMKQKRIVAVALGLALSVSPMIVLPTAFADQVSGNPSSSISARSTAPNPLDKFSTEEKAFLNNHKDKIASALGIDGFDPSTTDYYGVKESALDTVAGKIPTSNTGLLKPMGAPLEIDTNATGWLVDGKIAKDKPSSGDMAYRVTIKGKSGGTVAYTLHTASQDASSKADPGELKGVTATANGTAVTDFNPVKDGTYTVPDDAPSYVELAQERGARLILAKCVADGVLDENGEPDSVGYDQIPQPDGTIRFYFEFAGREGGIERAESYDVILSIANWEVTPEGEWLREAPDNTWLKDEWVVTVTPEMKGEAQ